MLYENKELGVSFEVADDLTLEDELAYYSATDPNTPWLVSMWRSALVVIKNWQCEAIPDPKALDLKRRYGKKVFSIVTWTGTQVAAHVNGLAEPDPNS